MRSNLRQALPSVADADRVDEHLLVRCLRLLPSPSPLPGPVPRRRDGEVVDELLDVFADPVQRKDQDLDRPVALQHLAHGAPVPRARPVVVVHIDLLYSCTRVYLALYRTVPHLGVLHNTL